MTATSAAFDLATYIATGSFGLTVGGNLGVNTFLDKTNNEAAVFEFSGDPDLLTHGNIAAFEYPKIQVQVRNTDAAAAYTLCKNIYDFLRGKMDLTLNGNAYLTIEPTIRPKQLVRDEQNREIWHFEVKVERRAS